MNALLRPLAVLAFSTSLIGPSAAETHEAHHQPQSQNKLHPVTVLELESVRRASARFHDVEQAVAEGYVDIGLFMPNMGWHYMKEKYVDDTFELDKPELLVYADDPCGGPRKLVAVEYAVPLALSKRAPRGFSGRQDSWDANQQFQLWTLHAWIWEHNPDGVFASHNSRVP